MSSLIPSSSNLTSRKVAVIGAGAAGLVASRELGREGHEVVVYERNNRVEGTWVYDPNVESDQLGIDPSRSIVHSSLYESLRTNLPREIMGFRDYPFVSVVKNGVKKQRDPRRYPGHKEVLNYLEDFASDFQLTELIRFETEVVHVGLLLEEEEEEEGRKKWLVKSRRKSGRADGENNTSNCSSSVVDEVFDAVVVCSGHFTEPNIAEIPGTFFIFFLLLLYLLLCREI
ncbi:Flavin monooxygenase-like [Macleaya cordata]|uniref:Flavin-containing monooxygenase n=1 Tax=Macleaya cordata TaxID=56857 RepID=A0A200RBU9_MACCD|nr:Flavin monooxygenase-like [Macleaya cordata]